MHTRNSERTSPLVFEPEIERVARRNLASRLEATLASNQASQTPQRTPSIETDSMANQNPHQFQYQSNFNPAPNIQPMPQERPGGNNNTGPPTPPFQNQNPNNNQRTPQQQNPHQQASLPLNFDDRNVNSDHRGNRDRGNPANEDPFFNLEDLRNAIPDDAPHSVPGYQSPEHVSIHTENSDDGGYYDDRVNDDEDWGYVNQGNIYNNPGFEGEEFDYQNANYVGNDDYGYGDRRNDGYGNNRLPRNNNQRNRNDGFYNNNGNPNRIPRFVGGGNQMDNQGGNRRDDRRGDRGGDRRDNRRPVDQEVNGPHRRQQPPQGVNDRFRPVVTDNDSPIVYERRMFDCKPHYINILPHFNGRSNDEPYTHLAKFSSICSTIGV